MFFHLGCIKNNSITQRNNSVSPIRKLNKVALNPSHQYFVDSYDRWNLSYNNGTGYSQHNNQQGILANNNPSIMGSYLEMFRATNEIKYLESLIFHGLRVLAHRDDNTGFIDYTGFANPVWSDANPNYVSGADAYPFMLESGLLIQPLLEFALLVKTNKCLETKVSEDGRTYLEIADFFIEESQKTIEFHHEPVFHTGTVGGIEVGWWTGRKDTNIAIGIKSDRVLPMNYMTIFAHSLSLYIQVAAKDTFRKKLEEDLILFINFLKLELKFNDSKYLYEFNYWPKMPAFPSFTTGTHTNPEDFSHAKLTFGFVQSIYDSTVIKDQFPYYDMVLISRAITDGFFNIDDNILYNSITGTGTSLAAHPKRQQIGTFSGYSRFSTTLIPLVERFNTEVDIWETRPSSATGLLSIASYIRWKTKGFYNIEVCE